MEIDQLDNITKNGWILILKLMKAETKEAPSSPTTIVPLPNTELIPLCGAQIH